MPSALAQAIANAEGFGVAGAIPTNANNPGDISLGDQGYGAYGNITIFPTVDAGWAALENQLAAIADGASSYYSPNMSLAQMGNIYAGGDPNWAVNVASYLGLSTADTFTTAYQGGTPISATSSTAFIDSSIGEVADSTSELAGDVGLGAVISGYLGSSPLVWAGVAIGGFAFLVWVLD